jgi:anti-sigma factor RsiW
VTGYVDDALDEGPRAQLEAHLDSCPACSEQFADERAVRSRLRALPAVPPRPGLEDEVRRRVRRVPPRRARWLVPVAAGVAIVYLWLRGAAPFVAWELARDHGHCFGMDRLPATITSGDPARVTAWFEERGTPLPAVPDAVGPLTLVGARYCPLPGGSTAAHLYYVGDGRRVSLFVLSRRIRVRGSYSTTVRGTSVRLLRLAGAVVGIVGERERDVGAFERSLMVTRAAVESAGTGPAP